MRIDAFNTISQVYNTSKQTGVKSTNKSSMGRDEVQISSFGRDYQVAKQAVAEASDVREDKVAEMKNKYSGDVQVDVDDFATALFDKYNAKL